MTDEPQYSIAEAARRLGMAPSTLRDKCTRHEVPHHRRHGVKGIYFTAGDLDEILESQRRPRRAASAEPGPPSRDALDVDLAMISPLRRSRGG